MKNRWLKGNTHTHTTYSDGDSPPEVVVDWYAEHGYDFVFLTDHNVVVPDDHMRQLQRRELLVWPGEEITMGLVHVNGLGIRETIPLPTEQVALDQTGFPMTPSVLIRWASDRVTAQQGLSSINHPNLYRGLNATDVMGISGARLLEIGNMSSASSKVNSGNDSRPSTEHVWDALLASQQRIWAVASDDAHHFKNWGPAWSNPGRGWVMIEAEPDLHACLAALDEGRFYASTGPELSEYRAGDDEIIVELATSGASIELIGPGYQVLDSCQGVQARFSRLPKAPYLRVRVCDANGGRLWTQPYFLS
ncbi:MAG TPA: CehA/McbA family metallohydrolase [Chloroflexota bacterium]|jgi:hypothetical protein|nr:CehA/McbA family metallohydrolase [Chloroflexota bacterium]